MLQTAKGETAVPESTPSLSQQQLITEHIPFTKSLARQFYSQHQRSGASLDDLEGSALLGLCDAATRYDRRKGNHFRTYAYYRIRGAMYDLLRQANGVKRSAYKQLVEQPPGLGNEEEQPGAGSLPYAFARTLNELLGIINSIDEIEMTLHISPDGEIDVSSTRSRNPEELSAIFNARRRLREVIQELPDKQRKIIELHYFRGLSFVDITQELGGCSKSWVSRMHSRAIDSLQKTLIDERESLEEQFSLA